MILFVRPFLLEDVRAKPLTVETRITRNIRQKQKGHGDTKESGI